MLQIKTARHLWIFSRPSDKLLKAWNSFYHPMQGAYNYDRELEIRAQIRFKYDTNLSYQICIRNILSD
jgi:hypothetical protein